jgi:hypothetical protein
LDALRLVGTWTTAVTRNREKPALLPKIAISRLKNDSTELGIEKKRVTAN